MKRLFIVAALFCLAVPAAFAAPPAGQGQGGQSATPTASELCKQQRRTMGMAGFQSTYAANGNPKDALDACVARHSQLASTDAKNAAKYCKAERVKLGEDVFKSTYGTNKNDANAFGKCVSSYAKDQSEDRQESTLNAAKKCKAERAQDPAAFKNYGTNANMTNAFGKCVSKLAKAQGSSS